MSWFGPQHVDLPPLEPMWSSTTVTGRGTLTFLGDGTLVVGWPNGVSDAERAEFMEQIGRWRSGAAKTLVLPWPVDVSDLRPWLQSGDES